MGSGNYTFGMKPTYLTKASCAVMDVCELVPRRRTQHPAGKAQQPTPHSAGGASFFFGNRLKF